VATARRELGHDDLAAPLALRSPLL
jgi:hypothetical protein